MKTDSRARYQGYTFFFKEGFCWNNILNPQAKLLKSKLKQATVNDVSSMSLMSVCSLPNMYFVSLLNSELAFIYYREFINCTVNIQINDLRQMPIIIPTEKQLQTIYSYFQKLYHHKKHLFDIGVKDDTTMFELENHMNSIVNALYGINL